MTWFQLTLIQIKSISKINFKNDFSVKFNAIILKRKAFYKVKIILLWNSHAYHRVYIFWARKIIFQKSEKTHKAKGNQNIEEAKNLRSRMFSFFRYLRFYLQKEECLNCSLSNSIFFLKLLFIRVCVWTLEPLKSLRHFTSISRKCIHCVLDSTRLLFCYVLMFLFPQT